MIKRNPLTKTPLLANGWPGVRLTPCAGAALIGAGLRRVWTSERRDWRWRRVGSPTACRSPLPSTGSVLVPEAAGELHPLENAQHVRGGLMGNSATVSAGQEQHLRALEYANRVRLARARMKRRIAAGELSAT